MPKRWQVSVMLPDINTGKNKGPQLRAFSF